MNQQADEQLKQVVEALLFVSPKPLSVEQIGSVLEELDPQQIRKCLEELKQDYTAQGHSFVITEVAGGFQMATDPVYAPWLRRLLKKTQGERLSGPSLETLAIIAYKQPVIRQEIESIRGVNVEGVLQTLLEKGLIRIDGRKEVVGRPLLYRTTREFLEYFGLNSLEELPTLEAFVQQGEKVEEALSQEVAKAPEPVQEARQDDPKKITP